jgi:hypothetical protein
MFKTIKLDVQNDQTAQAAADGNEQKIKRRDLLRFGFFWRVRLDIISKKQALTWLKRV